ncbi:hypothetical protein X801_08450 [Opisthorchis viverrini]|uniref:Uncharacterized protein n=1 Tax=Opisthorchis viverrini TaxID=6198 RepID=A0A1S8WN87_OPIVI|nr:hypothetical protein X801_08450 [Opisthorchis viverrini]
MKLKHKTKQVASLDDPQQTDWSKIDLQCPGRDNGFPFLSKVLELPRNTLKHARSTQPSSTTQAFKFIQVYAPEYRMYRFVKPENMAAHVRVLTNIAACDTFCDCVENLCIKGQGNICGPAE